MRWNDPIIDITADAFFPERRAEDSIEDVALDKQVSICQPRNEFLYQSSTLVRYRQPVEVHDLLEQLCVLCVGLADFLERTQLPAGLAMAIPAVCLSPTFWQHSDLEQKVERLLEHNR